MNNRNRLKEILIPDGESPFTLFVINVLSVYKDFNIHVISSKKNVEARFSRKIKSFTYYKQNTDEESFIDVVKKEIKKREIDILLPLHFDSIRCISKNKQLFNNLNIITPPLESLDISNNKWKLSEYLEENGFPGPKTYHVDQLDKLDLLKLRYPFLLKPLNGWNGNNIKKINDSDHLKKILKANKPNRKFIIQEYITGTDFCVNVICLKGKILAHTIQKGILPGSGPFQPHIGFKFLQNDKLYSIIADVMRQFNWSGVANLDIRFNEKENQFYIIEINPRFWGSVEASAMIGVNFPYLMCLLNLGIPFTPQKYRSEIFINNRGLLKLLKSKILFRKERSIQIENNSLKFSISDPLPKIFKYTSKVIHKLNPKKYGIFNQKKSECEYLDKDKELRRTPLSNR